MVISYNNNSGDLCVAVRELLYFEWIIYDNCNLNCPYCVTKGDFSHKENRQDVICFWPRS